MYSAVQDKSANYTVVAGDAGDLIRVTTTSGAITITLPTISTVGDGFKVAIVKWTGDGNAVSVVRSSTNTINGATSASIGSQYSSTTFVADYETNQWFAASSGLGTSNVAVDVFSGNGSTTAFTLSGDPGSKNNTLVEVSGVYQQKSTYTVSGTTLTFSTAPPTGTSNIEVVWTAPLAIGTPSDGSVTTAKLASTTGSGAVVLATSPTITTPTINQLTSAASTALTLQSAGTTAMTIDTSQNVGIGTTSPASRLDINSSASGGQVATFRSTATNGGYVYFQGSGSTPTATGYIGAASKLNTGGSVTDFGMTATTNLVFGTNDGTERMRIDSSGNLLVGTTSALSQTGRLTVVGAQNGLVTQIANGQTAYQCTNTSGTGAYYAGIWSNNGNTFSTCGYIQVSGTTCSYVTSSDYRLKENIAPMTGALAKVAQLKPVTYKWKSDGTEGEGFIAHELAEVCPYAVSGEKDALKEDGSIMPQGIDTSFLVATLTAALQETKALIDTQAETINALTARIVALEGN
jgi:hypothetical protein